MVRTDRKRLMELNAIVESQLVLVVFSVNERNDVKIKYLTLCSARVNISLIVGTKLPAIPSCNVKISKESSL